MPRQKKSATATPPPTKEDVLNPQIPISVLALRNPKTLALVGTIVILTIAVFPSAYFYNQYRKTQSMMGNPAVLGKQEIDTIIEQVSKLIELPAGENPTVASVSDINKLKDQPFFAHAQNGDKVLIYTKAQKAILYRPSVNKIIEVGPVNLQPTVAPTGIKEEQGDFHLQAEPTAVSTISATPALLPTTAEVRVSILNGTNISGLTKKVSDELASVSNIKIINRGNAQKRDYTKTLVIDISGNNDKKAKEIAHSLGGEVGALPEGESKPSVDILIIAAE